MLDLEIEGDSTRRRSGEYVPYRSGLHVVFQPTFEVANWFLRQSVVSIRIFHVLAELKKPLLHSYCQGVYGGVKDVITVLR